MTQVVQIGHAKTHLSALLELVEAGEEIVIARRGKPIARLVPNREPERSAADALAPAWALGGLDLTAPAEPPADTLSVELD
jgi:prevent-host-death family protein